MGLFVAAILLVVHRTLDDIDNNNLHMPLLECVSVYALALCMESVHKYFIYKMDKALVDVAR